MDSVKKLIELFKSKINGMGRKKLIENSVIIIIIGVIIIIAGSTFFGKKSGNKSPAAKQEQTAVETFASSNSQDTADLEKRLEKLLAQIQGAGRVNVMITYVSGNEKVPAQDIKKSENDTNEKDSGGGTRNIQQDDFESSTVYSEEQGGGKNPVILKELQPEVRGVVVVADGADDPVVKERLSGAVQTLMAIPAHKVQILKRSQ